MVARLAGQQLHQVQERVRVQLVVNRNCIEAEGGQLGVDMVNCAGCDVFFTSTNFILTNATHSSR